LFLLITYNLFVILGSIIIAPTPIITRSIPLPWRHPSYLILVLFLIWRGTLVQILSLTNWRKFLLVGCRCIDWLCTWCVSGLPWIGQSTYFAAWRGCSFLWSTRISWIRISNFISSTNLPPDRCRNTSLQLFNSSQSEIQFFL
jgi:hypothetical protein